MNHSTCTVDVDVERERASATGTQPPRQRKREDAAGRKERVFSDEPCRWRRTVEARRVAGGGGQGGWVLDAHPVAYIR